MKEGIRRELIHQINANFKKGVNRDSTMHMLMRLAVTEDAENSGHKWYDVLLAYASKGVVAAAPLAEIPDAYDRGGK